MNKLTLIEQKENPRLAMHEKRAKEIESTYKSITKFIAQEEILDRKKLEEEWSKPGVRFFRSTPPEGSKLVFLTKEEGK